MSEPGPVGTIGPDLAYQGGFRVFKQGSDGLDEIYAGLGQYPEGELKSRTRISWVEIDTQLDKVDVARVHFIDPERRVAGYVAELWNNESLLLEPWTVIIGYHFMPEHTWAKFSGVPVIEDTTYPQEGPPEVTIRLFAPGIVMARRNTSNSPDNKLTRHWLHKPQSVEKALEAMAKAYGVGLNLGSMKLVIEFIDSLLKENDENPTPFMRRYSTRGALASLLEGFPVGVEALSAKDYGGWATTRLTISTALTFVGDEKHRTDATDWKYLDFLRTRLQPVVSLLFKEESTGGVQDKFWSAVKTAGNKIVFGFMDGNLYFCRLRDLDPHIDEIVMFSYQALDHSLLSFTSVTNQTKGGTDLASGLAKILAMRSEPVEKSETDKTETEVKTSSDSPESRVDEVGPSNETYWTVITKPAGDYAFRIASAHRLGVYEEATEEEVLGSLATTLTGDAELVGAPFIRAGKLIATYGLGVSGESKPEPDKPQRTNVLDRVWLVSGCTHRVDSTGLFKTTVSLKGAGTDDSKKIPEEIASSIASSLDPGFETEQKNLSMGQKIAQFFGFGGG